jgi:hypothetical protein
MCAVPTSLGSVADLAVARHGWLPRRVDPSTPSIPASAGALHARRRCHAWVATGLPVATQGEYVSLRRQLASALPPHLANAASAGDQGSIDKSCN